VGGLPIGGSVEGQVEISNVYVRNMRRGEKLDGNALKTVTAIGKVDSGNSFSVLDNGGNRRGCRIQKLFIM